MSSTDARRKKYAYRKKYIEHNPGLFHFLYFCAQCGKPVTRKNMEVDHIVPLAKFGVNHVVNCTATCRKCNRSIGAKVGFMTIKGLIAKIIEEILITIQRIIETVIIWIFRLMFFPFRKKANLQVRLLFVGLYVILGYYIFAV